MSKKNGKLPGNIRIPINLDKKTSKKRAVSRLRELGINQKTITVIDNKTIKDSNSSAVDITPITVNTIRVYGDVKTLINNNPILPDPVKPLEHENPHSGHFVQRTSKQHTKESTLSGQHLPNEHYQFKTISRKATNIPVNLKEKLSDIQPLDLVSAGLTVKGFIDKKTLESTLGVLVLVSSEARKLSTVKLNKEHARLVIILHIHNAYEHGINEEELIRKWGFTNKTINELLAYKCIEIIDGKVYLIEKVVFKNYGRP